MHKKKYAQVTWPFYHLSSLLPQHNGIEQDWYTLTLKSTMVQVGSWQVYSLCYWQQEQVGRSTGYSFWRNPAWITQNRSYVCFISVVMTCLVHQLTSVITTVPELQGTTADIAKQKCKMAAEMVYIATTNNPRVNQGLTWIQCRSMAPVLPRIHAYASMLWMAFLDLTCKSNTSRHQGWNW